MDYVAAFMIAICVGLGFRLSYLFGHLKGREEGVRELYEMTCRKLKLKFNPTTTENEKE